MIYFRFNSLLGTEQWVPSSTQTLQITPLTRTTSILIPGIYLVQGSKGALPMQARVISSPLDTLPTVVQMNVYP